MKLDDLTVVIPALNSAEYVDCAIRVASACRPSEIIFCDDASIDATYQRATSWAGRGSVPITVHRNSTNLGMTKNWQHIFQFVKTSYCLKLDVDDVIMPRYVERAVDLLRSHPSVVTCSGLPHAVAADALLDEEELRQHLVSTVELGDPVIVGGLDAIGFVTRWFPYPASSSTIYRMSAWRSVGGFATDISVSADVEIFFRLLKHGDMAIWHSEVVQYRLVPSSVVRTHRRERRLVDDLLRTYLSGLAEWRGTAGEPIIRKKVRRLLLSKAKSAVLTGWHHPRSGVQEARELVRLAREGMW